MDRKLDLLHRSWLAFAAFAVLAVLLVASSSTVVAHWGVPDLVRPTRERMYPSAKHGGNYMHNFYFPQAPSSTPWAPSWSPDGRWIAVAMSGSIWRVDPKTGVAEELTCNEKYHSSPDWSPDGQWIVYTADDGGQTIPSCAKTRPPEIPQKISSIASVRATVARPWAVQSSAPRVISSYP